LKLAGSISRQLKLKHDPDAAADALISYDAALKFQLIGQSCGSINPCPCLARAIQKQEMLCTKDKQKPTAKDAAPQMTFLGSKQRQPH